MIFIHLKIIGEEKYIYLLKKFIKISAILFFFLRIKYFCNLGKPFDATATSKPNFYYIVYDMIWTVRVFWLNIAQIRVYKLCIYCLKFFFLVAKWGEKWNLEPKLLNCFEKWHQLCCFCKGEERDWCDIWEKRKNEFRIRGATFATQFLCLPVPENGEGEKNCWIKVAH